MKNDLYNLTESELEEFDQLYEGTIDENSFYVLKAKLHLDEVLKHKYTVYKMLRKEIELDGLSNQVLKLRFVNLDKQAKNRKRNYLLASIMAIAAILIAALIINPTSSNEKLYNQYKNSEGGISIRMSSTNSDMLNKAMIDIGNNDYENAILKLQVLPQSDTALFYLGYCNERREEFEQAKETYYDLLKSNSDFIRHKSSFRLALLKLKSNDNDAIQLMDKIAKDTTNPYSRIAQEIILSSGK